MRKITLLSGILMSISVAYCQEFTFKIGGGYGWAGNNTNTISGFQPLLSNNISDAQAVLDPANASIVNLANTTSYGRTNTVSGVYQDTAGSKSLVHGSYGKGFNIGCEIGYKINPYIAVAIGFNYLFGNNITATQLFGNSLSQTLGDNTMVTTTTYAYGLSMSPNVTAYAAKKQWKLKPYVRVGLNLPVWGTVVDNIFINSPSALLNTTHLTSNLQVKTQGEFTVGYTGGLGLSYNPIPLISVWAEINGTHTNVGAKSSTLTEYEITGTPLAGGTTTTANRINGTGTLPPILGALGVTNTALTQYSLVIDYVDNVNANSNTTDYGKSRANTVTTSQYSGTPGYVNESQPHQEQRIYAPFTSLGLAIGITVCMSKKIFQDPLGKKQKEAAK